MLYTYKEPGMPLVFLEIDESYLRRLAGAEIEGSINLPSGRTLPTPPPGHVWHVTDGSVVARPKDKGADIPATTRRWWHLWRTTISDSTGS